MRKKRIPVYWDLENVKVRGIAQTEEFIQKLSAFIQHRGKQSEFRAYAGFCDNRFDGFKDTLLKYSGLYVPVKTVGKQSADQQIISDLVQLASSNNPPNTVVLVTGDNDFRHIVGILKKLQIKCIVFAFEKSSGRLIRAIADEFYTVESLIA